MVVTRSARKTDRSVARRRDPRTVFLTTSSSSERRLSERRARNSLTEEEINRGYVRRPSGTKYTKLLMVKVDFEIGDCGIIVFAKIAQFRETYPEVFAIATADKLLAADRLKKFQLDLGSGEAQYRILAKLEEGMDKKKRKKGKRVAGSTKTLKNLHERTSHRSADLIEKVK